MSNSELAALAQELTVLKQLLEQTHQPRQRLLLLQRAWALLRSGAR